MGVHSTELHVFSLLQVGKEKRYGNDESLSELLQRESKKVERLGTHHKCIVQINLSIRSHLRLFDIVWIFKLLAERIGYLGCNHESGSCGEGSNGISARNHIQLGQAGEAFALNHKGRDGRNEEQEGEATHDWIWNVKSNSFRGRYAKWRVREQCVNLVSENPTLIRE